MLLVVWMTARSSPGHGYCRIKPRGGSTPPPFPAQAGPHPAARFIFAASVSSASPLIYLYLQQRENKSSLFLLGLFLLISALAKELPWVLASCSNVGHLCHLHCTGELTELQQIPNSCGGFNFAEEHGS